MKINNAGLELLKKFEGCRLKAYKLKGERNYTIGYGHSDSNIKAGTVITQVKADEYLKQDLAKFENYVAKNTKFVLNDNQFSALVSYTYNRGYKGFKQLMDNSNVSNLSDNIVKYWGSNENYKSALIKRRKSEQALFNTPVSDDINIDWKNNFKVPSPTLRIGSRGVRVEQLQKCLCLNNPKINITIDGHFGKETCKALKIFQEANFLQIDGVYGKHTYNKMRDLFGGY